MMEDISRKEKKKTPFYGNTFWVPSSPKKITAELPCPTRKFEITRGKQIYLLSAVDSSIVSEILLFDISIFF
jgi:hypothetical protein